MSVVLIEAFASLGLFMFGMLYLEDSLKKAAGASFKRWVKISTDNDHKALLTGTVATAALQSSSITTLMALSLVGAGLMSLQSSIGVIFGSNIGSTATGWVIALIGFKFDIKLIALGMVGFGGIGSVIFGEGKTRHVFGGIAGFGLIFLGIEGLKETFIDLSDAVDIEALRGYHPGYFILLGFLLTAIIQSSAAAIALAQSALYTGILGFEHAAAFVIGANVGTTLTAVVAAIGGTSNKKRAALAHVAFNVSTGIVAFILLYPMTWGVTHVGLEQNVEALALFHTLFNVLGVTLWFPFISPLSRWLENRFIVIKPAATLYLHNVPQNIPALANEALHKEVLHLGREVCAFALSAIQIPPEEGLKPRGSVSKLLDTYKEPIYPAPRYRYHRLQTLQGDILDYAATLSLKIQLPEIRREFDQTLAMATQLIAASKHLKDLLGDIEMLSESDTLEMTKFYHELRYQILALCMHYNEWLEGDEKAKTQLEQLYLKLDTSYQNSIGILSEMILNYKTSKEMTAIFMNIAHLVRNFSRALYRSIDRTVAEATPG